MPATSSAAARHTYPAAAAGDEGGDRDHVRTAGAYRRARQRHAARGRGSRLRARVDERRGAAVRRDEPGHRAARQSGRRPGHGAERPAGPEASGCPMGLSRDEGRASPGGDATGGDQTGGDSLRSPLSPPIPTQARSRASRSSTPGSITGGQRTGGGNDGAEEPGTVGPAADPRRAAAAPGFRHPQDHAGDHPGPRAGAAADTDHPAARGRRAVAAGSDAAAADPAAAGDLARPRPADPGFHPRHGPGPADPHGSGLRADRLSDRQLHGAAELRPERRLRFQSRPDQPAAREGLGGAPYRRRGRFPEQLVLQLAAGARCAAPTWRRPRTRRRAGPPRTASCACASMRTATCTSTRRAGSSSTRSAPRARTSSPARSPARPPAGRCWRSTALRSARPRRSTGCR